MKVLRNLAQLALFVSLSAGFAFADSREVKQSTDTSFIYSEYKGRDGAAEAARDLKHNAARVCIYGRMAGLVFLKEWSEASEKRFGVKIQAIAGCIVTADLVDYAKCYNHVILEFVAKKYGGTAWADCEKSSCGRLQKETKQMRDRIRFEVRQ